MSSGKGGSAGEQWGKGDAGGRSGGGGTAGIGAAGMAGKPQTGGTAAIGGGGIGGEPGSGGTMSEVDGCVADSSSAECEFRPEDFCVGQIPFECPYTLEKLQHTATLCKRTLTQSLYQECDDLVAFTWSEDLPDSGAGGAGFYQVNLQFSSGSGELVAANYVQDEYYDDLRYWAGSWQEMTNCQSCVICPDDAAGGGGGGGEPSMPSAKGEACLFDAKGRISLPPVEE
jgi:hypothetical protein